MTTLTQAAEKTDRPGSTRVALPRARAQIPAGGHIYGDHLIMWMWFVRVCVCVCICAYV